MKHNPYLGVELTDNLKYNDHIDTITSKASRVLGFVKRNLKHCPRTVKERAYQTLVRPKLEYSSPIWNPQHKAPIKKIEQVQRNAARFVLNKRYQNQNQNSLLVKRQTDNTTPGGMGLDRRGLVPSSHKRSKFRHTII